METSLGKDHKLVQLTSISSKKYDGNVLSKGRHLVGRAQSCDFVINDNTVSAVHAVIEVFDNKVKVYDMNSLNGTLVNSEKVVAQEVNFGDRLQFGNVSFSVDQYHSVPELPPVLDTLEPEKGESSIKNLPVLDNEDEDIPYIVYPLSKDPKADYSEYIFEDQKDLYPIFKYEHGKDSIEVIVLHNDSVFSVDYLPFENGVYKIKGAKAKNKEIEFPYLGKEEVVPFVEVQSGNCIVHQLHNYKTYHLSDKDITLNESEHVNLQGEDIVKMVNGSLEIYIRKTYAPPVVKTAPFFRRDKNLAKTVTAVLLLILLPVFGLSLFEVDPDLDKEKDPERIATILYKRPLKVSKKKTIDATKKEKPVKQKKKEKVAVKPKKPKEVKSKPKEQQPKPKKVVKKPVVDPGVKTAAKKQTVKKVKNPAPKVANKKPSPAKKTFKSASSKRASSNFKSKGPVDTFKSFNFKSAVSKSMVKGGSLKGSNVAVNAQSSSLSGASVSGGFATNLKKANVATNVGSLTGAARGKLAQTKGTEGLAANTGVYTAGLPSETVVLGSMDPDDIRRLLREHIPQFRYCYQQELDTNPGRKISGVITLVFTIGPSGYVSKAGVGDSSLPSGVKRCVVGVLRGIQFPEPRGGGVVDVRQPINFYAEKL